MSDDVETKIPDLTSVPLADLPDLPVADLAEGLERLMRRLENPGASVSGYNGSATQMGPGL